MDTLCQYLGPRAGTDTTPSLRSPVAQTLRPLALASVILPGESQGSPPVLLFPTRVNNWALGTKGFLNPWLRRCTWQDRYLDSRHVFQSSLETLDYKLHSDLWNIWPSATQNPCRASPQALAKPTVCKPSFPRGPQTSHLSTTALPIPWFELIYPWQPSTTARSYSWLCSTRGTKEARGSGMYRRTRRKCVAEEGSAFAFLGPGQNYPRPQPTLLLDFTVWK